MQAINTKTFSEIWSGLTQGQQYSIGTALISEQCCTTRQTVWNWATNKTKPTSLDVKSHVAKIVGKVIGQRVLPDTLFPAKN